MYVLPTPIDRSTDRSMCLRDDPARDSHAPSPSTHPSLSVIPSVAKARGAHLRVHFKHVREVAHTVKGWSVAKAKQFLEDVLQYKRAVPFTR